MMRIRKELPFKEIRSFILSCLIFLTVGFLVEDSFSAPVKQPIIREDELVPKAVLSWPDDSFENIILVDKNEQKILVYSRNDLFRPEKVYKCSTGENDGPKTKKDDRRTPEGIYFFTKSFVDRELTPIYGVRAFPINYPNEVDKMEGKGGYGIWFHGTNKPLKPKDSNGCIVLDNGNIDDLANYVKLNETPVIISSNIEMVKPEELEREASSAIELVEKWRRAWEDKNFDDYISYYHRDFFSGNKNRQQWKAYKARLVEKYSEFNVEIDGLQLLRNDGLMMARFRQNYSATGHNSYGIKTLYFKKNSKEWRIIREVFSKE